MPRRGHGQGSLYQDADGRWHVQVDLGVSSTGKRRRKHITLPKGATKKEAQAVAARYSVARDAGTLAHNPTTVDQLLDEWLEGLTLQATTISTYRRTAANHIRPAIGTYRIDKVTTQTIDQLCRRVAGDHAAQRTHVVLSQAFELAVRYGWLPRNPAKDANTRAPRTREMTAPSDEQIGAWLAAAEGDHRLWLHLAIVTGARKGELCALRWADVDLAGGSVTIRNSLATPDGQRLLKRTKTEKARKVTLDAGTIDLLRSHRRNQQEMALAKGDKLKGTSYLFAVDRSATVPWRPDTTGKQLTAIAERAGVYGVRIHDLRHLAATRMLAAGIPVNVVSARLGHSRVSTTLDVYGHVIPGQDAAAAEVLARVAGSPTG